MSKIEVDAIDKQSGSTLTLGGSGTAVTLACGATQTGFGREGSVDWQTTKKTTGFTATSGEGYFCDTAASGAFTLTLPSSPSAGDIVGLRDYNSNFATANLTIGRGGSNLMGNAGDKVLSTNNLSLTLVYVDGTQGWIPVEEGTGDIGLTPTFISASGGTETTCGNFRIHTFTGPGTFTVCSVGNAPGGSDKVDYLVVAGGGGGGRDGGGGGGAGGFRASNCISSMPAPLTSPLASSTSLTVTATGFPITVGGGGNADPAPSPGSTAASRTGSNSVFSTITSAGGGGSGNNCYTNGANGGSGGGASRNATIAADAGSGNTPPVSPPQGNDGNYHPVAIGGGGGGADPTGAAPVPGNSGSGGTGSYMMQTGFAGCNGTTGPVGSVRYFAGGGVGGHNPSAQPCAPQTGGAGGGGAQNPSGGIAGTVNTGGGGGAGDAAGSIPQAAGGGGSGIVIIRYKFQ